MKKIRNKLSIEKSVITYIARHTFSTVMKRSGASTEFIKEAPGHTNIKTTENYLDSFEKEVKKEFANRLASFKKQSLLAENKSQYSRPKQLLPKWCLKCTFLFLLPVLQSRDIHLTTISRSSKSNPYDHCHPYQDV